MKTVKLFKIPITIRSTGVPIVFDPPIDREPFDLGKYFKFNLPITKAIRMKNQGKYPYIIMITPKKPSKKLAKPPTSCFQFESKKSFTISPGGEVKTMVTVVPPAGDFVEFFEDNFSVDLVSGRVGRLTNIFDAKFWVNIYQPVVQWSRKKIDFVFFYGDDYNKKSFRKFLIYMYIFYYVKT